MRVARAPTVQAAPVLAQPGPAPSGVAASWSDGHAVPYRRGMTDQLLLEVDGHVATITFNRPDRMNTITPTMLHQLSERLLEADADPEVRAIIITGAGRAWCAGLDIAAAAAPRSG